MTIPDIVGHDEIKFSPKLDESISNFTSKADELDSSDFNIQEYINNLFPTEDSISSIEAVLENLKRQVLDLDQDIEEKLKLQRFASR